MKESKYPYEDKNGTCRQDGTGIKIPGYHSVTRQSVNALKAEVAKGPIQVELNGRADVMQHYKTGVINSSCDALCNHAVAIVGYTSKYYIIKNSWGSGWGDIGGYAYIAINGNGDGMCG